MLYLYCALIISYFLALFIDWEVLSYLVGILAMFSWFFSFPGAKRLYQIVGSIFFIVGICLFFYVDLPYYQLPLYMTSTVTILAMFVVLPFINSIIVVGRYDQHVNKLLKSSIQNLGQLYYRSSLASFLLGTFLNIATLPLVKTVIEKNLKDRSVKLKNVFISQTMLRGYALSLAFSPMEILVAISIEYTETSYLVLLPWLLTFSITLLLIDWVIGRKFKSYKMSNPNDPTYTNKVLDKKVFQKISMLFIYLALFISCIMFIQYTLDIGFLSSVALVIIPYSLIWALSIKRFRFYLKYTIPLWKKRTLSLKSYMVLFLSVGLFTSTLNQTALMNYVQKPFAIMSEMPIFLFLSIQVLFLLLAMIGFHPLVTISVLGGILQPMITTDIAMSLAVVLVTSSLSTVMAGPYNITVSLTGSLLQINPYRISFWNLGFAFLFSSMGTAIGLLLYYVV